VSQKTAIVAGNGPSLADIPAGVVLNGDMIIRTNSFFLEPTYYLGDQVDLAYVAGDPKVAPFVLATMQKVTDHYHIAAWTAQSPLVAKAGQKHLHRPFTPFQTATPEAAKAFKDLSAQYQAQPTAGVCAMFQAQAHGAQTIILAGIDLYATPKRYTYEPGKHMRDLLGQNLGARAYDTRLHSADLDRALIDWMASQSGMTVLKASTSSPLDLDPAPMREGNAEFSNQCSLSRRPMWRLSIFQKPPGNRCATRSGLS